MSAGRSAPPREIVARAPVRLDLGGGWTDVPPFDAEQGGFVCNLAIARYATVRLSSAGAGASADPIVGAALAAAGTSAPSASLASDFPAGAGLGGSSAVGIAAAAAAQTWAGGASTFDDAGRAALAERSRRTEVESLGVAGGRQDHYAAAFGGALALTFSDGPVQVERIALTPDTIDALERRLIVVYTGESRISAVTIEAVLDAYARRDRRTLDALLAMRGLARTMAAALARGAVDDIGALLGEHWVHQRALHPAITTPRIEAIVAAGAAAGALGAKALGASGGGCVVVAADAGREDELRRAVAGLGEVLPFRVDEGGVEVRAG